MKTPIQECPTACSRGGVRDIPKETIARWIARDEAEMAQVVRAGKRKKK